ncbi:MAG: hypothetical protein HZA07_00010 [Nitrospirae bacterium]|nr:hypothetical protein [Nitrospirota bacterium]
MKVIGWVLFGLAVASFVLGVLTAAFLPFTILDLTPGGYLRVTITLLLFAITLYVLKKP